MATLEVAEARNRLADAQRCVHEAQDEARRRRADLDAVLARLQQCRFDEVRRRGNLERALAHQQNLYVDLQQIERVLASGGQQTRLGGSLRDLQVKRRRLKSMLTAAPG